MKIMQFVKDFWKMIFMQKIFEFISICLWFPSRFEFPLICENPLRIFCCFWMIFGTNSLRIFQKLIFSKKSFKNISICLWFGSWLARASKKKKIMIFGGSCDLGAFFYAKKPRKIPRSTRKSPWPLPGPPGLCQVPLASCPPPWLAALHPGWPREPRENGPGGPFSLGSLGQPGWRAASQGGGQLARGTWQRPGTPGRGQGDFLVLCVIFLGFLAFKGSFLYKKS